MNMNLRLTIALILTAAFIRPSNSAPQSFAPPPGTAGDCTLVIHVTGFRNQKGVAGGTVFKTPDGWPEDNAKSFRRAPFPIVGDHAILTFPLPPGRYGVAVLHDENRNRKLDRNFLGVPKEGFGFANNPHVGMSAPKWQDAAVNVTCPVMEINVRLIYK